MSVPSNNNEQSEDHQMPDGVDDAERLGRLGHSVRIPLLCVTGHHPHTVGARSVGAYVGQDHYLRGAHLFVLCPSYEMGDQNAEYLTHLIAFVLSYLLDLIHYFEMDTWDILNVASCLWGDLIGSAMGAPCAFKLAPFFWWDFRDKITSLAVWKSSLVSDMKRIPFFKLFRFGELFAYDSFPWLRLEGRNSLVSVSALSYESDFYRYDHCSDIFKGLPDRLMFGSSRHGNFPSQHIVESEYWDFYNCKSISVIAHTYYCVWAEEYTARNYKPVLLTVDLDQLVRRTVAYVNQAEPLFIGFGLHEFVGCVINVILTWFSRWSAVAPPVYFSDGRRYQNYVGTWVSLPSPVWEGLAVPTPLAMNLSLLVPYIDHKNSKVYYPILDITEFQWDHYKIYTYTGFVVNSTIGDGGSTSHPDVCLEQMAKFDDFRPKFEDALSGVKAISTRIPTRSSHACAPLTTVSSYDDGSAKVCSLYGFDSDQVALISTFVTPRATSPLGQVLVRYEFPHVFNGVPSSDISYSGFLGEGGFPSDIRAQAMLTAYDIARDQIPESYHRDRHFFNKGLPLGAQLVYGFPLGARKAAHLRQCVRDGVAIDPEYGYPDSN